MPRSGQPSKFSTLEADGDSSLDCFLKLLGPLAGTALTVLGILGYFFSRPRPSGEIIEGSFFTPLGATSAGMLDAEIILKVRVFNKGYRSTTVGDWELVSRVSGTPRTVKPSSIPNEFVASRQSSDVRTFRSEIIFQTEWPLNDLANKMHLVEHAHPVEGWLRFIVHGADSDDIKNSDLIVKCRDGLNRTRDIKRRRNAAWPAEPKIHDTRNVTELMNVQSMTGPKPNWPDHPPSFER